MKYFNLEDSAKDFLDVFNEVPGSDIITLGILGANWRKYTKMGNSRNYRNCFGFSVFLLHSM